MSWWENFVDAVPVVGTAYRTGAAIAAHATGDHEAAQQQWAEAGMNAAGDALGLVTGGAGKMAAVGARTAAKVGGQVLVKEGMRQAAKQGIKAGFRAAGKQLTKKAIKRHVKKYLKKKIREAIEEGIDDYFTWRQRQEIISTLLEEDIELSRSELESLSDDQLFKLLQFLADDDDD